jgi:predicted acetyltransferase
MTDALAEMNDKGMTFSYLYPFSYVFYEKFGYDPSCGQTIVTAPLEPLLSVPIAGSLEEYYPGQPVQPFMQIYNQFASTRNLMVDRDEQRFKRRLQADPEASGHTTWLYRAQDGTPMGYLTYCQMPDSGMDIEQMAWSSAEGLKGLMGLLGRFAGNRKQVRMPALPGLVPEVFWPDLYQIKCEGSFGGMNRVVNAKKAFEMCAKPWFEGSCVIEVKDASCPWNTGRYHIEWAQGGCSVMATSKESDIVVSANALSALVTGRFTLQELSLREDAELKGNERMLSALFPVKANCIQDYF